MGKKIIFVILIAIGIFLRLWQLNTLPGGLFLDEVNMAVDAKSLAQNGVDQYGRVFPFYFEDATDFKLPVYIYLITGAYKIFGNQILSVHLPSALAGIGSIFLLGYLTYILFPKKKLLPYFAMVTLALSPFAIHFSRIGYETNVGLFFILWYLIALIKVLQNTRPKMWLVIGSIAILLADWTYPSPRFIIPIFTTCILLLSFFLPFDGIHKKPLKKVFIFLGCVVITFIPTFIFPYADTRQLSLIHFTAGHSILETMLYKFQTVFVSLIRLWNFEFLFDKGDLFAYRHGTKEIGIFLSLFSIPLVIGAWRYIKSFSRKNFSLIFLMTLTIVCGLPSALTSSVPYGTRVVPMLISYSILMALGMDVFFGWLAKQKTIIMYSLSGIIGIILLYQIGFFSYTYFVHFAQTGLPEFPTAPKQFADYITTFRKEHPTTPVYFLTDRECHPWGNDALHLWYFANLSNKDMIVWNTLYRQQRYAMNPHSPFSAYENKGILPGYIPSFNLYVFPSEEMQANAPSGSLFVRCGYQLETMNTTTEKVIKIFYMYSDIQREPYYVVTTKRD